MLETRRFSPKIPGDVRSLPVGFAPKAVKIQGTRTAIQILLIARPPSANWH
jgi:hypothetical protein